MSPALSLLSFEDDCLLTGLTAESSQQPLPITLLGPESSLPPYALACGFKISSGKALFLPSADGQGLGGMVVASRADAFAAGGAAGDLARSCAQGIVFSLDESPLSDREIYDFVLGWMLGAYRFDFYKPSSSSSSPEFTPLLLWPSRASQRSLSALSRATRLVRDLVNCPAADLGPEEFEAVSRTIADRYHAHFAVVHGVDLEEGFPAIHAVGKGAERKPRLLDLRWGSNDAPLITIVGKGIVFDSGGLDLKPASAMRLMKKDMGGAAHALALSVLVMELVLPVSLRLLLPLAENAVSATAMRPGDVIRTRKGLSVEISNTDAEGRLILADALAEADRDSPALLIDFATLTGAARVALGADLPALFSNDDALAEGLMRAGQQEHDPVWRLPLWDGYRNQLDSKIADLDNAPEGGMAGAILAALFLQAFVSPTTAWAHLDTYAWNAKGRPGRPQGGDALGLRAAFAFLQDRFPHMSGEVL